MHVEPGMGFEPFENAGGLVGAVVIADQMNLQLVGDFRIDLVQEFLELDGPVPAVNAGDDGAVGGIERGDSPAGSLSGGTPRLVVPCLT